MFFRKKQDLQRLNLQTPQADTPPPAPAQVALPQVDPARSEAVQRKAKEILDSGRIPDSLFVCSTGNGLLTFRLGANLNPIILLFSTPFSASDYAHATNSTCTVGQIKVETLPQLAQGWTSVGVAAAALDRCPRCPQFLTFPLSGIAKWTREDFAKTWSVHRATRLVLGAIRIQAAMKHLAAGAHSSAREDLEYVRDHFDCGVPYLHQKIGMIAKLQNDEPAVTAAMERLKEFGPPFDAPIEFSPQVIATVDVGLMMNFGILPLPPS